MSKCDSNKIESECDQDSKCTWDTKSNKCRLPTTTEKVIGWIIIIGGLLAVLAFLFYAIFRRGGSDSSPDRSMLGDVGSLQKAKENIDFMDAFGDYD